MIFEGFVGLMEMVTKGIFEDIFDFVLHKTYFRQKLISQIVSPL